MPFSDRMSSYLLWVVPISSLEASELRKIHPVLICGLSPVFPSVLHPPWHLGTPQNLIYVAPLSPRETFSSCSASCCPGPGERQSHRPWSPEEGKHTGSVLGAVTEAPGHLKGQGQRPGQEQPLAGGSSRALQEPCACHSSSAQGGRGAWRAAGREHAGSVREGVLRDSQTRNLSVLVLGWAGWSGRGNGAVPHRALSAWGAPALPGNKNTKLQME